ncbi:hypothetical protein B0H94_10392 [Salsuginibacillus halophilus]|uniref:Uncharacterized protein n=1 Tax=Salsuginibacillus halophilus TaxID=517424 RepID=A0A2P8HW83_9BACI|nr:hypothetical protein [Salsuginibacillus halophilus]PSL50480.1 hypothetical protein B0H94_10392 [Salsuginibacillus halophilus]
MLIYYAVSWCLWVFVTFFSRKGSQRTIQAFVLLICISTGAFQLQFGLIYELNGLYVVIFLTLILSLGRKGKHVSFLASSAGVFLYAAGVLTVFHSPAVFYGPPAVMIALFLCVLSFTFSKSEGSAWIILFLSLWAGESLTAVLLLPLTETMQLGSTFLFLHTAAYSAFGLYMLQSSISWLNANPKQRYESIPAEIYKQAQ